MAASSSSPAAPSLDYWLYNPSFVRVAKVSLPSPQPALVLFQGTYYVWSQIDWAYVGTQPYNAGVSGLPDASVLSNPQF